MQNTVENVEQQSGEPEGLIKTPRQLIVTVILAFVIPIFTIVMLVKLVSVTSLLGGDKISQSADAIAQRIQPVAGFKLVDADAPTESKTGDQVYASTCAACHDSGLAGAPKLGDAAAWAPLIDSGFDAMLKIALEGKGAMPARGGNADLSDLEVARAVTYMANQGGGSFAEPEDDGAAADDASADTPAEAPEAATEEAAAPAADTTEVAAESTDDAAQDAAADEPAAADTAVAAAEIDPAGKKLYDSVCFACHTSGVAGAPKLGDKGSWARYIDTGFDAMMANAIKGVGAMPPRGGTQASDDELKAALQYMLSTLD